MWKLSDDLHRLSTGPVAAITLVVFLLFTALVLPQQASEAEASTGGADSPDTSLVYSPAELYAMAEAYGPEGRAAYVRARFTFDLIWPLVYLAFLVTAIGWLSRKAFAPNSAWRLVNLVPVAGAVLDYLENVTAALVVGRYPARTPVVDLLAPIFTFLKWIFVGGSFVVLAAMLLIALWRFAMSRSAGHRNR
ncbi:MAG: hypothetical protein JXC32_04735 [Anaerolineae bacterium]|nr:hypothetical protein [Anaerolineae bacterium]